MCKHRGLHFLPRALFKEWNWSRYIFTLHWTLALFPSETTCTRLPQSSKLSALMSSELLQGWLLEHKATVQKRFTGVPQRTIPEMKEQRTSHCPMGDWNELLVVTCWGSSLSHCCGWGSWETVTRIRVKFIGKLRWHDLPNPLLQLFWWNTADEWTKFQCHKTWNLEQSRNRKALTCFVNLVFNQLHDFGDLEKISPHFIYTYK